VERRKNVRYPFHVPVSFLWTDENGVQQEGKGDTRDVSVSGVFVSAVACPPEGASVSLNILLSSDPQAARSLRLQAEAQVLRVVQGDQGDETTGFGVRNQKVVVLRGSEVIDEWSPPMTGPSENGKLGRLGSSSWT
jgi:hypothetical protein